MKLKGAAALALMTASAALSGCGDAPLSPLPSGPEVYKSIAASAPAAGFDEMIHPGDEIAIRVLGEPELTGEKYRVDSNGFIQVPLVGEVVAGGRKPGELRDDITRRLAARYIRDPQVAVNIASRLKSTFSVEGEVKEPGIFEATPTTTLLSALAQAKSPIETARLDDIAVFRQANGQRYGARFNLADIRAGRADDPPILAGDTVVVGYSRSGRRFESVIKAIPLLNIFYILR